MSDKEDSERIQKAAMEGGVKFAPLPKDAYFLPEFVERFSREILGLEWSDIFFVSEESSVLDFTIGGVADTIAKIRQAYGVDCSDIVGLNLWAVMQRCADQP